MEKTRISCDVCVYDDSRPEYMSMTRDGRMYIKDQGELSALHLFATRKGAEALIAALTTALRELDISEGKAKPGDEGVCDLGGNPFQCAYQQ